jgi:hypothetical protein
MHRMRFGIIGRFGGQFARVAADGSAAKRCRQRHNGFEMNEVIRRKANGWAEVWSGSLYNVLSVWSWFKNVIERGVSWNPSRSHDFLVGQMTWSTTDT